MSAAIALLASSNEYDCKMSKIDYLESLSVEIKNIYMKNGYYSWI